MHVLVRVAFAQTVQVVEGHLLRAVGWVDVTEVGLHNLSGFGEDHVEVDGLFDSLGVVLVQIFFYELYVLGLIDFPIYFRATVEKIFLCDDRIDQA